jgi:hypothetical protein
MLKSAPTLAAIGATGKVLGRAGIERALKGV